MKFSYFGGFGYAPREKTPAWPTPTHLHVQENVTASLERVFGMFALADELGFDWISTPEHHYKPYLSSNALLTAAVLSQRGYRAKIAVLGAIAIARDPISLAEDIATLDQLTSGNFVVALLRGNLIEQLRFGVDPGARRPRYEEAVELILTAWEETEPFGWEGRHYRYNPVGVWPRPYNGRRPNVFVSASSVACVDFAARLRVSIGLGHLPVDDAARLADAYRTAAARHGWVPTADNILYHCEVHVAETDTVAADEIQTHNLGKLPDPLGRPTDAGRRLRQALSEPEETHFAQGFDVLRFSGGPDRVARQIKAAADSIGFGTINLVFQGGRLPGGRGRECLRLFGEQVIPNFR